MASAQGGGQEEAPNLEEITAQAIALSLETVLYDAPSAGVIQARGATWKGEFTADGATYIPFLGSQAPQNFPLTFRLEMASVAGVELELAGAPTVSRTGDRVIIDHGPILEVYDLAPESIEQSFILPRRSHRGEIRVRMAVESELNGATAGRGLEFLGSHGGVRYGEAFALDAGGRRADVGAALQGRSIELTVPDAFPIVGTGELVIDPVLTTLSPISGQVGARNPDVAFEKDVDGGGVYVIVYETGFSSTDKDLYAIELRKSTGLIQNLGAVDISSDNTCAPKVAGNDGANMFLVVYESQESGSTVKQVKGRIRIAGSDAIAPPRTLHEASALGNHFEPDVGGENESFAGYWAVVWRRSYFGVSTIQGRAVSSNGNTVGAVVGLSASGTILDSQPTISEGSGDVGPRGVFNIAYTRGSAATDRDVYTGQVRVTNAGLVRHTTAFRTGQLGDFHSPAVSNLSPTIHAGSMEPTYIVAVQADGNTPGTNQVVALVCAGDHVLSLNNLSTMEDAFLSSDYAAPSVVATGTGFVFSNATDEGVTMCSAYLAEKGSSYTLALAERNQIVQVSNHSSNSNPALVSDWESGLSTSRGAFVAYDAGNSIGATVRAGFLNQHSGTRAIGTQYCRAQFNSTFSNGWLALYGGQDSSTTKIATASDMPVGQFTMLVNSRNSGFTANPGGSRGNLCLGSGVGRMLGSLTAVLPSGIAVYLVDPTALDTPSGLTAAQAGETWHFQAWYRDTYQGGATSNFTNGVRVEIQ